jgi:hypothetical protein
MWGLLSIFLGWLSGRVMYAGRSRNCCGGASYCSAFVQCDVALQWRMPDLVYSLYSKRQQQSCAQLMQNAPLGSGYFG